MMAEGDINLKLATAAENGDTEEVKKCLEKGADPNKSDALRYAAWKGHIDIVQLLLAHGADPNRIGALTEAAWGGYIDIVRLLLDHGADINASDALGYATWGGHTEIVELLLINEADPNKYDTLDDAASTGRTNIVKLLLAYGANPKESNALREAAKWGHGDIVFLLLEYGDDPEKLTSTDGKTDFSEAVQEAISKNQERLQQEYAQAISDSVETNCNITIAVLGNRGVGKTCFVKQLLQEVIPRAGPGATDTVDLHVEYIASNPETGFRKKLEENGEIMTCSQILKRITAGYRKGNIAEASMLEKEPDSTNTDVAASASTDPSEEEVAESSASLTQPKAKHYKKDLPKEQKEFIRELMQDTSKEGTEEVKGFVRILDFGGDSLSNDLHLSFLTSNMVFALVIDVNMCLDPERSKTEYEAIEYWLTHIATYALEDTTLDRGTPPVIIIGSNLDQVSSDTDEQTKKFAEVLAKLCENQQLREIMDLHVQEKFSIANLNDSTANQDVYEAVWQTVMEIAPLQSHWGKAIPSKWVALELELIRLKNNGNILLTYDDLLEVNNNLPVPLSDTEILQFLGYLKLTGTFLCFHPYTGHPFVVLQSKWVIDGFHRIVTDLKLKGNMSEEMSLQREKYEKSGVLTMELLTALWDEERFKGHFKTLCTVMESLNILVKPIADDPNGDVGFFIVPCMIPTSNPEPIRSVLASTVTTITLCTKFDISVIPRSIWDTLMASCIHKFEKLHEPGYDELKLIQRGFACLTFNATWNVVINCKGNVMKVTMFSTDTQSSTAGAGVQLRCILENLLQRTLEKNHRSHLKYQFYLHNDLRITPTDRMVKVEDLATFGRLQCFGHEGSQWINNEDSYVWFKDPTEPESVQNLSTDDVTQKEAGTFKVRRKSELPRMLSTVQHVEAKVALIARSDKRNSMSDRLPTISEDTDVRTEIVSGDAAVNQENKESESAAMELIYSRQLLEKVGTDDVTEYGKETAEKGGEQHYDTKTPAEEMKQDHDKEGKQEHDTESSEEGGEQVYYTETPAEEIKQDHDKTEEQEHGTESSEEGRKQEYDTETPAKEMTQDHDKKEKQEHGTESSESGVEQEYGIETPTEKKKLANDKEWKLEHDTESSEEGRRQGCDNKTPAEKKQQAHDKEGNQEHDTESLVEDVEQWYYTETPAEKKQQDHDKEGTQEHDTKSSEEGWEQEYETETPVEDEKQDRKEGEIYSDTECSEEEGGQTNDIGIQQFLVQKDDETAGADVMSSEQPSTLSEHLDISTDIKSIVDIVKGGHIKEFEVLVKKTKTEEASIIAIVTAAIGSVEMMELIAKQPNTKWDSELDIRKYASAIDLPGILEGMVTPLYIAASLDRTHVVRLLLKYSSNENIKRCFWKSPPLTETMKQVFTKEVVVKQLEEKYLKLDPIVITGHRAEDKKHAPCHIVYSERVNWISYERDLLGCEVEIRNPYAFSEKCSITYNRKTITNTTKTLSDEDIKKAKKALSLHQTTLWEQHSNLNIITVSPVKRRRNGQDDIKKPCIVLYCTTKEFIPHGPCGHVHRAIFNPSLDPSIDVAVVELTESTRIPDKGQFANAKKSTYVKAGFAELPEYNSGSIERDPIRCINKWGYLEVYKFGSTTDVTKGTLAKTGISVRTPRKLQLPNNGKKIIVQNQFQVIGSDPTWKFLDLGDSGSPVFMKSDTGELILIGMGIGTAFLGAGVYPVAVVTPIGDIMDTLGDEYSIASFP
ncbi:uncharacterized protein [Argopecten irradians]|uniref:uncharacterized protein isoform X2 n=1 Tax=Argopecten irradians TaxID=31199 RepID=UPI003722A590